ncbi:MAG TPA: bifunctional tetrahydrofolate synthase/dihydrofolate synthase [Xanthomonadales bacterium]|nr:bifunctional tetrahydrofolate synthase/dihydrofolate synthase [Xanthomonadales bacterium]
MKRTLAQWLAHQQRIHPAGVALGLERVRVVWQRLGSPRAAPVVVTVGGTNGKGSTVAFLEAMLAASGRRVGAYTSPHLVRYNERIRVTGIAAGDDVLVDAFERIEQARGDTLLTYFEFGTLAALLVLAAARLDAALLEVGLGGRLDAVNVVDADAAIVTTVDYDHMDYLGDDLEAIAFEKAGIFRAGRPAIVGERSPPAALVSYAESIGALLEREGVDFSHRDSDAGWTWLHRDGTRLELPLPRLEAPAQRDNAAAAIAALHALRGRLAVDHDAIAAGVAAASVPGRLQRVRVAPEVVVDVGHNPQAAREIARWLEAAPRPGRAIAVFAALGDKDIAGIVEALARRFDAWHIAGLSRESPRGTDAATLAARAGDALAGRIAGLHDDVASALDAALAQAGADDRVVAFGSFFTVAAALRALGSGEPHGPV